MSERVKKECMLCGDIFTARNSKNSEPAEKRKTNDLSLTRTCFPLYFSKFINIPLDIEKAVNSVESTAL